MKAWWILRKRGELRRALVERTGFPEVGLR